MRGLIKFAKPRWVREFTRLSPKDQQRILSKVVGPGDREVMRLGKGGERISDLVVNRHGLEVRKIPLLQRNSPEHIRSVEANRRVQREAEEKLRELAGGGGDFAHIRRVKGNIAYYDYAPGELTNKKFVKDYMSKYKRIQKIADQVRKSSKPLDTTVYNKKLKEVIRLRGELEDLSADAFKTVRLSTKSEKVLDELRKTYPGLRDIRKSNVVGGKLVDFTPKGLYSAQPVDMYGTPVKSPEGFSRKHYFSNQKGTSSTKSAPATPLSPPTSSRPRGRVYGQPSTPQRVNTNQQAVAKKNAVNHALVSALPLAAGLTAGLGAVVIANKAQAKAALRRKLQLGAGIAAGGSLAGLAGYGLTR